MRFMLMMNVPGNGPYQINNWSHEAIGNHVKYMKDFAAKLQKAGEWVDGQGLAGPDQAKLVKAGKDGKPVTDGVFAESKEFLAGFWIIDAPTRERAYEIAAEASMAPGADGKPLHLSIETREVLSAPDMETDKIKRG